MFDSGLRTKTTQNHKHNFSSVPCKFYELHTYLNEECLTFLSGLPKQGLAPLAKEKKDHKKCPSMFPSPSSK